VPDFGGTAADIVEPAGLGGAGLKNLSVKSEYYSRCPKNVSLSVWSIVWPKNFKRR
jgi:hypothetical protein